MVYYSALHWAKKAEASAKLAADLAQTEGKVIQLGFDGAMENGKLVFKHAPGGVEVPYQLVDDVEYELDLAYNGDLDSLTTMVVKNGADVINFVSAQHRSSTEPARVADMDAVMRYDATTGYRWLFKATFKVTPSGAKVFLLYPVVVKEDTTKITNCITEIPQDIKLELNNGTLTLKAGSKVYVPNGANKFDEVVTNTDVSRSFTLSNVKVLLAYIQNNGTLAAQKINLCTSGTTAPTGTGLFYNTTDNTIRGYSNGTLDTNNKWSLPLAILTADASGNLSIDQVFNGFGYIGSTVFALPGVKGLIPNGRNADGTLKNTEFTTDGVWISKNPYNYENATLGIVPSLKLVNYVTPTSVAFNEEENKNILLSDGSRWAGCFVGKISVSDLKITSLTPKLPFRAADMNDVESKIANIDLSTKADKSQFQVVTALPSSPTAGVFYFIKE